MKLKAILRKVPFAVFLKNKVVARTRKSGGKTAQILSTTHQYYRKLKYGSYNFVSLPAATIWTCSWIESFEEQYDLIIGIPRSGLVIANMIALKLGKPLATPDTFVKGNFWYTKSATRPKKINKILLVDDSINSGSALQECKKFLKSKLGAQAYKQLDITTAALVARPGSSHLVDMVYTTLPEPTLFEWNIMHSKGIQNKKLGVDLDGVLCPNFVGDDANEEEYVKWITTVPSFLVPAFEIDVIITNRLEKYRSITEAWLKEKNVKYKQLVMWDIQDKSERKNNYAKQKTKMVLQHKVDVFYESARWEAEYIHKKTKIPTLCIDDMHMFS